MDPLQWMGAVRMRAQTADKTITIIHNNQSIQYFEVKSCLFARNKFIKTFVTLNHCFHLKYYSVHNIDFSSEKVVSSESEEKYAQIKHSLQVKTVQPF